MRIWGILLASFIVAAGPGGDPPQTPPPQTHVAQPALGQGATIEAACLQLGNEDSTCKKKKLGKKVKAVAPFKGAALVQLRDGGVRKELLGVQTDAGWHVFSLLDWGTDYGGKGSVTITSARIKDVVPGGAPELVVTAKRKWSNESSSYHIYGSKEELIWVCGVGASNAPSCAEIMLAADVTPSDFDEDSTRFKFRLSHKFTKEGKLTRKVKGKWPKNARTMDGPVERASYENSWGFLFP
jgi:hypothetical protein